jgi:hypothetical protein
MGLIELSGNSGFVWGTERAGVEPASANRHRDSKDHRACLVPNLSTQKELMGGRRFERRYLGYEPQVLSELDDPPIGLHVKFIFIFSA